MWGSGKTNILVSSPPHHIWRVGGRLCFCLCSVDGCVFCVCMSVCVCFLDWVLVTRGGWGEAA